MMNVHIHRDLGPEQRHAVRHQRCGALLWNPGGGDDDVIGWLLECSEEGFAFAHRGEPAPAEGETIVAHLDPSSSVERPRRARVMRSERVHEDLYVVGCAFADRMAHAASASAENVEPSLVVRPVHPRTAVSLAA